MKPLFLLCGLVGLLSGCVTTQTTDSVTASTNPSSAPTASIQGSLQLRFARLYDDRIAYPVAIDGKAVMPPSGQKYYDWWQNVHPISAGEHSLSVQYRMAGLYTLPVTLTFNAKANHQYQIAFDTDIGVAANSPNTYADFWVTDKATNRKVSAVVRGKLDPKAPGYLSTFLQNHMPPLVIPEPQAQP